MGTVSAQITISELCQGDAKRIEALRKRIGRSADKPEGFEFSKSKELDANEADFVIGLIAGRGHRTRTIENAVADLVDETPDELGHGQDTDSARQDMPDDIKQVGADAETASVDVVADKKQSPWKQWLLWLCLVLSLACSVPNMFSIMVAIKGNEVLAAIVTATFTVAPLLLIAYGIKGWQKAVAYVPIAVEIFCNSAGFYGGMTGLQHSLYVEPTKFLHMVTTMTNSGNEGTAFILSISLAICISALAIVPVYQLEKR